MRFLASIYRFIVVAFALAATYQGWLEGFGSVWVPLDFQATFMVAVLMLWSAAATLLKGVQPPAWLKGFVILYVLIGALAAWAFQGYAGLSMGPQVWGIHVGVFTKMLVPVMLVLDFLLFDKHRRYSWHYVLSWMLYLLFYLTFVLVRAAVWPHAGSGNSASPYPYPGIDLPVLGWERLSINAAEYLVLALAVALAVFLVDRILPERMTFTV